MKIIGVIPARYKSSRFEGKPLADICGKPMIWWVYNQVKKVEEINEVYVATEDEKIKKACEKYGIKVIMTSDKHQTGTDRVGEVAKNIEADIYLNIQGDEPLIEPKTIKKVIESLINNHEIKVTNLMTEIKDPVELINNTVPKVITNKDNIGIYLTRSATPYPKGSINYKFYKQVCVYGFKPEAIKKFSETDRGKIEKIEDIEILRFIENGEKVQFIEVESETIAVDTPKDLEKVVKYIKDNNIKI
jgi:3-deoxy-manno-octulosonate cytidylyltransferase (CMP-KDO synthetase)